MNLLDSLCALYSSEQLNEFVKLCTSTLGLKDRPTRKEDRARLVIELLLNPQNVNTLWAKMGDLERKALSAAYHNEGEFAADAFIAQYGSLPPRPKPDRWSYRLQPILLDLFLHQEHILPALMPALKGLVSPPERFRVEGAEQLPMLLDANEKEPILLRVAETEQAGWHDLLLLLQMIDQRALQFTGVNDKLTPGSAETLLSQLLQGDFLSPEDLGSDWDGGGLRSARQRGDDGKTRFEETIRPFGLLTFAKGARLVAGAGTLSLTDSGRALLRSQEPELLLDAFETWTKESAFDEITRIQAVKGLKSRGIRFTPPGMRRERIVEALSWCPVGVWISITDFYRGIKVWRFDFQVEQDGIEKLYVGHRYASSGYYEAWADEGTMWLVVNGLYINAVLWEYLGTIGALDLAYLPPDEANIEAVVEVDYDDFYFSRYDGLFYFRINPLGAYLFGQDGDYQAARVAMAPLLQIDATGVVTVLDAARFTPMLVAQLEQVAVHLGEHRYLLDKQKMLLALEQETNLDTVREFLLRNSDGALPPTVERWFDEVKEASKAFTIGGSMVSVRAANQELLQLVLADAELSKFCTALGNRALVLPANRLGRLRSRLRELGYGVRGK